MTKRANRLSFVLALLLVLAAATAAAETIEDCVTRKNAGLRDEQTQEVFKDRGCTTGSTTWDGKRRSCSESVCWKAPPNRIIVSSKASPHSRNGDTDWSGPSYRPDRERAYEVCFGVKAKSKGGMNNSGVRGWMKLDVSVTHRRELSEEEVIGLVTACVREGAT